MKCVVMAVRAQQETVVFVLSVASLSVHQPTIDRMTPQFSARSHSSYAPPPSWHSRTEPSAQKMRTPPNQTRLQLERKVFCFNRTLFVVRLFVAFAVSAIGPPSGLCAAVVARALARNDILYVEFFVFRLICFGYRHGQCSFYRLAIRPVSLIWN